MFLENLVRKEDSHFALKLLIVRLLSQAKKIPYPHLYPHPYIVESARTRTQQMLSDICSVRSNIGIRVSICRIGILHTIGILVMATIISRPG
jgi:hypothetical protein